MNEYGNNRATLRRIIDELDLDLTKINENRAKEQFSHLGNVRKYKEPTPLEEILKKGVRYKASLLKRLVKEGYKKEECEICGLSEWLGKPIGFHLHHKDGDRENNELENLQVLCPNCHSQTENYAGKKNIKPPTIKKTDEHKKALRGISEDGQRFYDGYGNYKLLCPMCKKNFMNKNAEMCRHCYNEEQRKPKIKKEELFELLQTQSYNSVAKLLGRDSGTISLWHKYYLAEDGEEIIMIAPDKAPNREELKAMIRETSFKNIAKKFKANINTIRNWCEVYKLPRYEVDVKSYSDEEWEYI